MLFSAAGATRSLALLLVVFLGNPLPAQSSARRTIHVFVALADNQHQGIVPVPAKLGNGSDPMHNLYWGAAAGVKTFFARSSDWKLLTCRPNPRAEILERCIFEHRQHETYLVADAYRGDAIRQAIIDFFDAAAGANPESLAVSLASKPVTLDVRGAANLVAYVGHDGLMDFRLPASPKPRNEIHRDAIVLACASQQYFSEALRNAGAYPLLWTKGLMAPEAYTLKSALDGWIAHESGEQIRQRAAVSYDRYQKCGLRGAQKLFVSGW
jgi:hypothetical protein